MNWPLTRISEFCDTGSGGTPARSELSRYYTGTIPWVKSGELKEEVILDTEEHINETALSESAAKLIPSGSLLVALYGATVGRIATLGVEAATNQAVCYIIPRTEIDRRFLFYALRTRVPDWLSRRVGGAQPNISQQIIKDTKIPLPPLSEQKRIAGILDQADGLRRKRQQALSLTDQFLRSTFLDLFGDPVTNPKQWPMVPLRDRCEMVTGYPFKSGEYIGDTGIRLCRGANVLPDELDWSDVRYWRTDDNSLDPKLSIQIGDVLVAMDRPWISSGLKVARATKRDCPCLLVQRVMRLRSTSQFTNAYVYYSIRHPEFTRHCGSRSTETTVPHISANDIASYLVPDAPADVQKKFEELVARAEQQRYRVETSTRVANDLFDALVQRAFRGEL